MIAEQLCEEADPFEVAAAAIAYADKLAGGPDDEDEIPEVTPFEKKGRREGGDRGERGFEGASRRERLSDRKPEEGMTRLFIGAGREAGLRPSDIVGAIANEAGIASRRIGAIDISDRFCLVEVDAPVAQAVIAALKGTTIKGRTVTVRKDQPKRASGYREPNPRHKREKREPLKSRFDDIG